MKLLFLSPTSGNAGIDQTARTICTGLAKKGWDVLFVAPASPFLQNEMLQAGVQIRVEPSLLWWFHLEFHDSDFSSVLGQNAQSVNSILNVIDEFEPDAVFSNTTVSLSGAIAATLRNVPHVTHLHAQFEKDIFLKMSRKFESEIFEIFLGLGQVVTPSKNVASEVISKVATVDGSITSVPNGLEINNFESYLAKNDARPSKYILTGHLNDNKNQLLLVPIALELLHIKKTDFCFQILGTPDIDYLGSLKSQIAENNLEKHFEILGNVDDVRPFLKQAKVFMSTSKTETFPIAMLEAMACGLPVVSTPTNGATEILAPRFNSICHTPQDFAARLVNLDDPRIWGQESESSRLKVRESYSSDIFIEGIEKVIKKETEKLPGSKSISQVEALKKLLKRVLISQVEKRPIAKYRLAVVLADAAQTSSKLLFQKPFEFWKQSGLLESEILNSTPDEEAASKFDALYILRSFSVQALDIAKEFKKASLPIIFETDDNHLAIAQVNGDVIHGPNDNVELRTIVELADSVIVYSNELYLEFKKLNKHTTKLPTYQTLPPGRVSAAREDPERFICGFMGSLKKDIDFDFLKGFFETALAKYPNLVFEFIGFIPEYLKNKDRITHLPFDSDYERFSNFFRSRNWSVGIAPLADTAFNRSKTNNKFREYAAAGVPGIYSSIEPYASTVINGKTGLLVKNSSLEWLAALDSLLLNPEKRESIATAANQHVREIYSFDYYLQKKWEVIAHLLESSAGGGKSTSGSSKTQALSSKFVRLDSKSGYVEKAIKFKKSDKFFMLEAMELSNNAVAGIEIVRRGQIIFNSTAIAFQPIDGARGIYFFNLPKTIGKVKVRVFCINGEIAVNRKIASLSASL